MQRFLVSLSSTAVLTAAALAQCPAGAPAGLVVWTSGSGYAAANPLDDESITSPPVALSPAFNMPGAVGTLDRMWVNVNGEIYFTDSTLALTQPNTGASFGISSLAEMRGAVAGASARIAVLGGDHQGSIAAGAVQAVAVDTSVAGQVTVTWVDMRRFANATGDRFSFQAVLTLATGVVTMNYGTTFPAPASFLSRYVGISIGNGVGTTLTPSSDLSLTPNSGSLGLLYQAFGTSVTAWDLTGQTLTISPNGSGGYVASALVPYVPPAPCAVNTTYGNGCYAKGNSVHKVFATAAAAKTVLDGNSLTWTTVNHPDLLTSMDYKTTWTVGGGGAGNFVNGTQVAIPNASFLPDDDDGAFTYALSVAPTTIAVPGGTVSSVNISVNGILTMAAAPNNANDFLPSGADVSNNTTAPNLAFYGSWHDYLLSDSVANGTITTEETATHLYVSWNAVEAYDSGATGTVNPSTWQFQVEKSTGDVKVVYVSMDPSAGNADDMVVGATLAGPGATPGEINLDSETNQILDGVTLAPLTLTATRGVIGNVQTFTASNVPVLAPGLGFSFLFFAPLPFPGGLELSSILAAPCCYHQVLGLDFIGMTSTAPTATFSWTPGALPNDVFAFNVLSVATPGLNTGGYLTSNGLTSTYQLQ